MSIGASPATAAAEHSVTSVIEIDVRGRWDALALAELLVPFHSFLVQHTTDRWMVHARSPGCHGEPLSEAMRAIGEWGAERGLDPRVRLSTPPPSRRRNR